MQLWAEIFYNTTSLQYNTALRSIHDKEKLGVHGKTQRKQIQCSFETTT